MARRTSRRSLSTEWPATHASPAVGRKSVARMRIVVVFPAPFGPTKPKTAPSSTVRASSSTAVNLPYCLVSPRVSMIVIMLLSPLPFDRDRQALDISLPFGICLQPQQHRA